MKNKKFIFAGTGVVVIVFFLIATLSYKNSKSNELNFIAHQNSETFVREHSPSMGSNDAKIFITEFLDPECESCRELYQDVKSILKTYEGKVQLIIRYAPFHQNSIIAIKALEAARLQGKYWEALELLFEYQPIWGNHHNPRPELIFEYLPSLGIDMEKLKIDMESPVILKIINQDLEDLKTLKIRGTPTFFVNGKAPSRFGIDYLETLIKKEIQDIYKDEI